MGYITDLRKTLGHRSLVSVGVGCLIFDEQGRVLLQKRSDDNLWGNPGGSLEPGETIDETCKRELLEETGLEVDDLELFNIYSGEGQHHIYPNGDEVYYVNIIFKTNKYKGILKSSDGESVDLRFFDILNIPKDITKTFATVYADLLNNKNN